jgi:hypothetical protein
LPTFKARPEHRLSGSNFTTNIPISHKAQTLTFRAICNIIIQKSLVAFESERNAAKMISIKQFAQCLGSQCTCPSAHLRYEWLINLSEIPLLDCIILDAARLCALRGRFLKRNPSTLRESTRIFCVCAQKTISAGIEYIKRECTGENRKVPN